MPEKLCIDSLSAFVSVDADGNEGVCAWFNAHTRTWLPLVAADPARVESLRPIARELARETGKRIVLLRFEARTHLEEIRP